MDSAIAILQVRYLYTFFFKLVQKLPLANFLKMYEANYPELLRKVFIVNGKLN